MEPKFRIPLGDWVEVGLDWLIVTLDSFFSVVRSILVGAYDGLEWVLSAPPYWAVILIFAAIAWWASGWKLGVGTVIGFAVIVGVNQWQNAMDSLALVVIATVVAIVISIPLGIWAARSNRASSIIRPILDFMQTMPAMVYLIPALVMFRVGVVPGIVATIIFSMAPGVRFTELGIRGVDKEVVEAGHAFGSSPSKILRQIQLPLARPTIMAGVNQVIMLSLSMVVIAGMVGAGGLGGDVVASLSRIDAGLGFEAGIAVVILAIFLDRVTSSFGTSSEIGRGKTA
ncbi:MULTISPECIES: ABC transporter permease [Arthrobacter]|uniref:ABC transporter permease n=1 Tax=unclassified Arthrobacter TaxID=235627 RepID=UPI0024B8AA92|nr:ABC transporter permease subunit [Arthrobacter sp. H35-MC1]MDJ0316785.1 ABC transporter permease subunit [Arthrobacter sp. H35-MC1]